MLIELNEKSFRGDLFFIFRSSPTCRNEGKEKKNETLNSFKYLVFKKWGNEKQRQITAQDEQFFDWIETRKKEK